MKLSAPFQITSRLRPGVQVAGATISISLLETDHDGRTVYDVWIDLADGSEYNDQTLKSGCQGGTLEEGMASLLSFLGAAGEAWGYHQRTGRESENHHSFPAAVSEWAYQADAELYDLKEQIEGKNLVEV